MGIHGVFKEIGAGKRISLAKLSTEYLISKRRPFRVAIDISIWLFQIQAGKGGSNPALRTFYYRLVRLLFLNIHPLFVFDGPNKPLFKRNKRVGGPGVRVATVPEFLAKQLLKGFGLPLHIAPGEAEAECALLQREGIVDAVLSEDVDTLMFGSKLTIKNWTSESSAKSPTHVNLYDEVETEKTSGLTREGMVLVALMSGGDYIPEGIPGCGPKVACDAARAGFGRELCALDKTDTEGLRLWKERLQHEIKTNESKFFTRKNKTLTIPEEFPNAEVLGYYTNPCVSSSAKLAKLRNELRWDQDIDFAFLRGFTSEAFDWRCRGGAHKFIKSLAPAMLVRQLWLRSSTHQDLDVDKQAEQEQELVRAIHGKRQHCTTDETLEYRISFVPAPLVPIDLSIEEDEEDNAPGLTIGDDSDVEGLNPPTTTQVDGDNAPPSPQKRIFKPYDPLAIDKLWMVHSFLQLSCPLLIEDYEAASKLPKHLRPNQKAKKPGAGKKASKENVQEDSILQYVKVTKSSVAREREALSEAPCRHNSRPAAPESNKDAMIAGHVTDFKLPSMQIPAGFFKHGFASDKISASWRLSKFDEAPVPSIRTRQSSHTPADSKKRPSSDLTSPARSQRTIPMLFPSSQPDARTSNSFPEMIDLVSSPAASPRSSPRAICTTPSKTPEAHNSDDCVNDGLPETVTKRRRRSPLKRWNTEPVRTDSTDSHSTDSHACRNQPISQIKNHIDPIIHEQPHGDTHHNSLEIVELVASSSPRSERDLPSPISFVRQSHSRDDMANADNSTQATGRYRGSSVSNKGPMAKKVVPTFVLPTTSNPAANPTTKKKRIQLRESLAGSWREIEAEDASVPDLTTFQKTTDETFMRARYPDVPGRSWRKSGVEILDLTTS